MPEIKDDALLRFSTAFHADSDVAAKALAGELILVYPTGKHHRANPWTGEVRTWEVDAATVAELVTNYATRETRGLRQARLPVNEDHAGSRALGWFDRVVALPEGVGATFTWNKKGRQALEDGEFGYFSVEIYPEVLDRVTGEKINNVIAGGALTNYPFFGQATALHERGGFQLYEGGATMSEDLNELKADRNLLHGLLRLFAKAEGVPDEDAAETTPPAEFAQLREQVEQFTARLQVVQDARDAYAERVERLQGELAHVQDARAVERFSVMAEGFAHLPTQTAELAGHLRWLHEADTEGAHRDFFVSLLRNADEKFGRYFREAGVARGNETDAETRLLRAAEVYQRENPGVAYRDALDAVLAAQPELAGGV
jgi:phage I-like protein